MVNRLGKYELLGELGTSGMAVVYRAKDSLMDRDVALKFISSEMLENGTETARRLANEARLASGLLHPNIVLIYDVALENGSPLIAMECLPGCDLRELIAERAPLTLAQKIDIALQTARALNFAHAKGVLHRGVKPGNIRVLPGGGIKLMDFGIAKVTTEALARVAKAGTLIGSAAYMSPEQAQGKPLGPASDVFSFGIVLQELLTYRKPFAAADTLGLLFQIVHGDPPPIEALDEPVPAELKSLIRDCLKKNPRDRLTSFEPILERLSRLQQRLLFPEEDVAAEPASWPADSHFAGRRSEPGEKSQAGSSGRASTSVGGAAPAVLEFSGPSSEVRRAASAPSGVLRTSDELPAAPVPEPGQASRSGEVQAPLPAERGQRQADEPAAAVSAAATRSSVEAEPEPRPAASAASAGSSRPRARAKSSALRVLAMFAGLLVGAPTGVLVGSMSAMALSAMLDDLAAWSASEQPEEQFLRPVPAGSAAGLERGAVPLPQATAEADGGQPEGVSATAALALEPERTVAAAGEGVLEAGAGPSPQVTTDAAFEPTAGPTSPDLLATAEATAAPVGPVETHPAGPEPATARTPSTVEPGATEPAAVAAGSLLAETPRAAVSPFIEAAETAATPAAVSPLPPAGGTPVPADTGFLTVTTNRWAFVFIDDETEERQTPLANLPLKKGRHRLVLHRDGYYPIERTFEIKAGQTLPLSFNLLPMQYGSLKVVLQEPDWAFFEVEGGERGELPHLPLSLSVGRHKLKITREGYRTVVRTVQVRPNEETVLTVKMLPREPGGKP